MTKIKSCLLCKNYNTHPCECAHCEDWDNFHISESGKALREKIYGDGYQDGHKDGYDKGYDDAQANYERPKGKWVTGFDRNNNIQMYCSHCGEKAQIGCIEFCGKCGADMRGIE